MLKYDKRFALKCDQRFKDELEYVANYYHLTMGEVVRVVIFEAREELRRRS